MTENEAKTKTCCGPAPVVMALLSASVKLKGDPDHARCIGAECMAWRWEGYRFTKDYGTHRAGRLADDGSKFAELRMPNAASQERFPLDHVGFCGLAGRPE